MKQIIGGLSELKSEMMTNKILKPLELSNTNMDVDVKVWNKRIHDQEVIDKSPPTWFNTYWLLAECYMYRRISQILSLTYVEKIDKHIFIPPFVIQQKCS